MKMSYLRTALMLAAVVVALPAAFTSTVIVTSTKPIVGTTSGVLHGVRTLVNGRVVNRFFGVPYAQAPVGPLRFQPPLPLDDAIRAVDATRFRQSCMQPPHLRQVIYSPLHQDLYESFVSEDCLYLNMYVPEQVPAGQKLAVMVWLPGEGFDYGYANQYDGSYLAGHGNVIVVTVNYRLSVFGFLSTGDDHAPGNVGLRDQVLALKWLKDNVAKFGGNPQRLTVFGRLTGSISISALLVSPYTRQPDGTSLMNGAILQSGVAHSKWVFEDSPLEQARLFAKAANCSSHVPTSNLVECLRQIPAATLLKLSFSAPRPWRLVLDDDFLPQEPFKASLPKVNVMMGNSKHEGSMCFLEHLVTDTAYTSKIHNGTLSQVDFRDLVNRHLQQVLGKVGDERLADSVEQLYFCNESSHPQSQNSCRQSFLKFCGNMFYDSAVVNFANRLVTAGETVYRYRFLHRPSFSHFPDFISAAQGDEVLFVFGLIEHPSLKTATLDEMKLSRQMMRAWSNFAKTGNPNPIKKDLVWPPYNINKSYLEISTRMEQSSVMSSSDERLDFWLQVHNS